ncbi:hypothetical protein GJ744_012322 [Endocarpon pusillum]|uniref:Uncharacterized protein n=1 Tax=Endocarpon pusillum TaxID=364733 RepID=A0A8H7E248_9EURO|nr:hypothetical protein GJ744_012322 [Endocarpon pusillum]
MLSSTQGVPDTGNNYAGDEEKNDDGDGDDEDDDNSSSGQPTSCRLWNYHQGCNRPARPVQDAVAPHGRQWR